MGLWLVWIVCLFFCGWFCLFVCGWWCGTTNIVTDYVTTSNCATLALALALAAPTLALALAAPTLALAADASSLPLAAI